MPIHLFFSWLAWVALAPRQFKSSCGISGGPGTASCKPSCWGSPSPATTPCGTTSSSSLNRSDGSSSCSNAEMIMVSPKVGPAFGQAAPCLPGARRMPSCPCNPCVAGFLLLMGISSPSTPTATSMDEKPARPFLQLSLSTVSLAPPSPTTMDEKLARPFVQC